MNSNDTLYRRPGTAHSGGLVPPDAGPDYATVTAKQRRPGSLMWIVLAVIVVALLAVAASGRRHDTPLSNPNGAVTGNPSAITPAPTANGASALNNSSLTPKSAAPRTGAAAQDAPAVTPATDADRAAAALPPGATPAGTPR